MTDAQAGTLVLKNKAGDYFLVSQAMVEHGRVPDEHKAALEQPLAEADGDVSGYIVGATYGLIGILNAGATALGNFVAGAAEAQATGQAIGGAIRP
jgi:hypothetical protein